MSDLERMICGRGRADLPWRVGTEPIRRGPDTQAEIDRCLNCPYPECVNCLSRTESGMADGSVGRPEKASSMENLFRMGIQPVSGPDRRKTRRVQADGLP